MASPGWVPSVHRWDATGVHDDVPTDDRSQYPDSYNSLCPTCVYLSNLYGPDDGEFIDHISSGINHITWYIRFYSYVPTSDLPTSTNYATVNLNNNSPAN